MNVQKSVAVIAAMLITAAGFAGIVNYSNAAAAVSIQASNASAARVVAPVNIDVAPSQVIRNAPKASSHGAVPAAATQPTNTQARVPDYTFAADSAGA